MLPFLFLGSYQPQNLFLCTAYCLLHCFVPYTKWAIWNGMLYISCENCRIFVIHTTFISYVWDQFNVSCFCQQSIFQFKWHKQCSNGTVYSNAYDTTRIRLNLTLGCMCVCVNEIQINGWRNVCSFFALSFKTLINLID